MAKINLTDITNGANAVTAINANSAIIETRSDTFLSRNGDAPNQMEAVLNMNSNRITNLGPPVSPTDAARFADVGNSAAILDGHLAATDPHTQYQLRTERGSSLGDATLDSSGLVPRAQLGSGTASGATFLRGDGVWTTPPVGEAALAPGDYGDIEVTNGGNDINIAADVLTPAGRSVIGAADAAAQRTALGLLSAAQFDSSYFELAGTANSAVAAHSAAADPHTGYQRESEKGQTSGYASLDANGRVPAGQLGSGTANNTTYLRGDGTWSATGGGGGAGALDDLSDVLLTAPATGATLVYNGTQWVNGKLDLTDSDAANFNGTSTAFYEQGSIALTTTLGYDTPISTTISYTRIGRVVYLRYTAGSYSANTTSGASEIRYGEAATANTLPASVRPVTSRLCLFLGAVGDVYGGVVYGPLGVRITSTGTMSIYSLITDPDVITASSVSVGTSYKTAVLADGTTSGDIPFPSGIAGLGLQFAISYTI